MNILKYGPIKAVFALLSVFVLLPVSFFASDEQAQKNLILQAEHLSYLENEFYQNYTPVDEGDFADFDLEKGLENGIKLNEIAVIGTHNSYQTASNEAYAKLYNSLDVLTFGIVKGEKTSFNMESLTNQLQAGIRSFEIDVIATEQGFTVCHDPLLDNTSSCFDFELMLKELILWSEHNPDHLPISVLIEPKKTTLPVKGMSPFGIEKAKEFDTVLKETLKDKLLTPADMMGDYSSLKAMAENDGWPLLKDTLGKFIFILHPTTVTDSYVKLDKSVKTQAMFPMVRYEGRKESYAAFLLENDPKTALKNENETIEKNLIVRTRADEFLSFSDERYAITSSCRSQIVSTDYPLRAEESNSHFFSFDGYTVKKIK